MPGLPTLIEETVRKPGVVPVQPAVSLVKEGKPTDEDFPNTPGNGILAYDKTGKKLYARIEGEWVEV